jgi:nitrogen fixation protein
LNADFFGNELERPVITIQSTPKAYGHFTLYNAWRVKGQGVPEINIGAGTLDRPIENVLATLLHEMIHQHNAVNGIQDVSRGGHYHNRKFKESAEQRGLLIDKSEKYGWCITEPADNLLEWILENDIPDIELNRNEFNWQSFGGGGNRGRTEGGNGKPIKKSSYRKYICPLCFTAVRATKEVNVKCGDCNVTMEKEGE